MQNPFDQSTYQLRCDWGMPGLARLAPADVTVIVDVLRFSSTVTDAVAAGHTVALDAAGEWSRNGAALAGQASGIVLLGCLRNATAVAQTVLAIQDRRAARTSVNVIAAGELADDGSLRFAVEDQFGAGAIISALSDRGVDHTSPEAAATGESARGLSRAFRHLLSASGSGRELADGVAADARMQAQGVTPTSVEDAAILDATDIVPVLNEGNFIAFR